MSSTAARPPFRADHVGSLLRPPELREARARAARGEIDRSALRAVEDTSIRAAVSLQESVGLSSITDGEFRRDWWHIDFLRGFDGVETSTQSFGVKFEGADEQPPLMKVTGKIRRTRPSMLDHFTFLKSATTRTAKFCLPSPVMLHARGDRPSLRATYPDLGEFWADLTAAYREEIGALCRAGCTYLQIDDTTVAMMCDPRVRAQVRTLGDDPERVPGMYADAVNAVLRDVPPEVTVAVHTCRGNFKSTWMASGGYDPVAETVFTQLNVRAFFLEYDTDRAGGFEPLRFVPKGKMVVLGLISSKVPGLEKKDDLKRRIDAAARYVPLENLCLSPQCGFSSTHHGNTITIDDQKRKLALALEVARDVWGAV
ncbi:MAG: 5-methyltetrahydropteroyltriglutamate--homocysteine S-methyltransferase [Candidatus Rokuibacteriota bacterium]|nr:MAG: 5-methyltetrahydropteroyltriglutamate--homocysteine S-methyltransferase [Candidatus Rokubacteria bacterium]